MEPVNHVKMPDLEMGAEIAEPAPEKKNKSYKPLWKRLGALAGLELVSGVATSYVIPHIAPSLPPTFIPLLMSPFLDGFAKRAFAN